MWSFHQGHRSGRLQAQKSEVRLDRDHSSASVANSGETEISPKDPKVDSEADSKEAPKGGDEAPPGEEQPEAVVPPVEEEADELLLDPEPKDLIPEAEAKKRNRAWEDFVKKEVHEISKEVPARGSFCTYLLIS